MPLTSVFSTPAQVAEKQTLPILRALIQRYADERPFAGLRVACSHILVRNSLAVVEALHAGGAELVLCDAHHSPAADAVEAELAAAGVSVLPVAEAAQAADIFVDVNAVLGRLRTPRAAAEVTRTGVLHYTHIDCPVVSADDCKSKRIEGFFGTGDGFLRAWAQLRPGDPLPGKRAVLFGYGKIGRGVARRARAAGLQVTVVDAGPAARQRAAAEGFVTLDIAAIPAAGEGFEIFDAAPEPALQAALAAAQIVISVTGQPGIHSRLLPPAWLRANYPVLVSLGAEDEYGTAFEASEIMGGKAVPLNFHLAQPTLNRYVDPPLAAHVLALEAWALAPGAYTPGIHPLPEAMDRWILTEWRRAWPDEDLDGIGAELGLE
jgi:adenosylhomocysteinase